MTREEVIQFTNHIRTLRTSPPTFAKQLRADEEIAEETEQAEKKPKATRKKLDPGQLLKDLTARAQNLQFNSQQTAATNATTSTNPTN